MPAVALPLPMAIDPLLPEPATPELNTRAPLAPALPPVPEDSVSAPLLPDDPAPVPIVTAPPGPAPVPAPDEMLSSPPEPEVPAPAAMLTAPPDDDWPDDSSTEPP